MRRIRITDLAATGHPKECARLLIKEIGEKQSQVKKGYHIKENGHKLHLYIEGKDININVYEGNKDLHFVIPLKIALEQSEKLIGSST